MQQQDVSDSNRWRLFLRRFAIVSAMLFLLWQSSLYLSTAIDNRQHEVVMSEAVRRAEHDISNITAGFATDLAILAEDKALLDLASGDTTQLPAATREFEVFTTHKPHIAQLRYLDDDGQEIIRIDRNDEAITVVPPESMQNKAGRYYFKETIGLPEGAIYTSAIDLNIEHGVIEDPWRPMLRIATPIQPAGPETRGIVIINVNADILLNQVERAQPSVADTIQFLNSDGYWLSGVPRDQLWGFMFDRETTFAAQSPEAWSIIRNNEQGTFVSGGTRYIYRSYRPAAALSDTASDPIPTGAGNAWKLVATTPSMTLLSMWQWHHVPTGAAGLLLAALIALHWSRSTIARQHAEAERRRAEANAARNERLASLGGLVAGIAHELNTPIGNAITLSSTLAECSRVFSQSAEEGPIRRSVLNSFLRDMLEGTSMMERNLERASSLIRHFKQVAVDQTSEQRREFRVGEYMQDILSSLQPQFKGTPLTLQAGRLSNQKLNSYPGPLSQVIFNLIANARVHAFDEGQTGTITLEARDIKSGYVEIVVRDDGKGIPDDVIGDIFEPFYTTRLGTGGSGLGLSIVHNIATNMLGGSVEAISKPGQGTSMIVRIPVSAPDEKSAPIERSYHVDKHAA